MAITQSTILDLVDHYSQDLATAQSETETLDSWYRGTNERPWMPSRSSAEYRELQERAYTPWLGLVVTAVAQSLYVEGYRRADDTDESPVWGVWQANGMDARQIAIHRGALAHGVAYATVLPGRINGENMPVIRGVSARKMITLWANPGDDEWPMYALRSDTVSSLSGNDTTRYKLYDDQDVHTVDRVGGKLEYITSDHHGVGVCPIIQYSAMSDLDGRVMSDIEALIPVAARIDQDTFDRLIVQRFGSWVVRTISGMEMPETNDEMHAAKLKLRVEDILVSESQDTKFGTLPGTPLDGYISARDSDIRDLAAVSQTPPHHLLGQMANLSAEALAAAEASLTRKVAERQHVFGEAHEQTLRLASELMGIPGDPSAEVRWRDMESRSLAQAADALGKIAQMLNVPVQLLWEKIPGWTQEDVERAKSLYTESDAMSRLFDSLAQSATPPEGT